MIAVNDNSLLKTMCSTYLPKPVNAIRICLFPMEQTGETELLLILDSKIDSNESLPTQCKNEYIFSLELAMISVHQIDREFPEFFRTQL